MIPTVPPIQRPLSSSKARLISASYCDPSTSRSHGSNPERRTAFGGSLTLPASGRMGPETAVVMRRSTMDDGMSYRSPSQTNAIAALSGVQATTYSVRARCLWARPLISSVARGSSAVAVTPEMRVSGIAATMAVSPARGGAGRCSPGNDVTVRGSIRLVRVQELQDLCPALERRVQIVLFLGDSNVAGGRWLGNSVRHRVPFRRSRPMGKPTSKSLEPGGGPV